MIAEPSADRPQAGTGRRWWPEPTLVAVFLICWTVIGALQWRGGAFAAEFGAYPDEPAHYVTGLLVRDYLADLAPGPPMEYARQYYLHYPKVAFGHWPPVFYIVQAVWTLPFSASRTSIMLLMACLGALLATTLFQVARRHTSPGLAAAATAVLLFLPMFQEYSRQVMAEVPQALFVFWAVLAYARYLAKPGSGRALLFAGLACLALLNKPTGLFLAPLPVLAVLLTKRFRLYTRPSFWLPAIVVPLVCAPWYLYAPSAMHQSAIRTENLISSEGWLARVQLDWIPLVGLWLVPLVLVGLAATVGVPLLRRQPVAVLWAAGAAFLISIPLVRVGITATNETRHTLPAMPVLLMFAAAGLHWLGRLAASRRLPAAWRMAAVAVATGALSIGHLDALPPKQRHGFSEVAADLLGRPRLAESVFLIASDASGEGMLIAEVAMREARPGHIVLRASKVLSSSDWMGNEYLLRFDDPAEIMAYLEGVPVGVVVLDREPRVEEEHLALLRRTLELYESRWELLGTYPATAEQGSAPDRIEVYTLVGHEGRPIGDLGLELPE